MLKVAARFGVSSSYMARVCSLLSVPRPEHGYWAKVAVGKAPKQPALPEARPGDPLAWVRDGVQPKRARPSPRPPERKPRRKRTAPAPLPDQHALTSGVKPLFEAGRLSHYGGYLKPAKKLLVDLAVTKIGLDKALVFANDLFLASEVRGHHVVIAPNSERFHRAQVDERENPGKGQHYNNLWSTIRCTVVYIGTVAIGLTIIEMSEEAEARYVNGEYVRLTDYVPKRRARYAQDHCWTSTRDFPTGRLCLQAYSRYPRADWSQKWREIIDAWAAAKRLDEFFADAERRAEWIRASKCELKGIDHVDATVLKVEDIPGCYRQMVTTSDCGNLTVGYAHRKSEFLAIAH